MKGVSRLLLVVLAMLGGCAEPPTFAQVAPSLPPLAPNMARIFVYRDNDATQNPAWVPVFFNGARVGAVPPGHVIMRDVPPGSYNIEVASQGLFPNQNVVVVAAPGQTFYAKIGTVRGINPTANRPVPLTTYVVVLMDPQIAQHEIAQRWYSAQNNPHNIGRDCDERDRAPKQSAGAAHHCLPEIASLRPQ